MRLTASMVHNKVYVFRAVGMDAYSPHSGTPCDGVRVLKVKNGAGPVRGCPKNGTMGHCYVASADTGEFFGLVLESSLTPEGRR